MNNTMLTKILKIKQSIISKNNVAYYNWISEKNGIYVFGGIDYKEVVKYFDLLKTREKYFCITPSENAEIDANGNIKSTDLIHIYVYEKRNLYTLIELREIGYMISGIILYEWTIYSIDKWWKKVLPKYSKTNNSSFFIFLNS